MVDLSTIDLLTLTGIHKRVANTNGGEFAGPCPLCGGRDRFRVWPNHPGGRGRWWCRQCGKSGDAIDFLRESEGLSYTEALEVLGISQDGPGERKRPGIQDNPEKSTQGAPYTIQYPTWDQKVMRALVDGCAAALASDAGAKARAWLAGRGISDNAAQAFHLGYNPIDQELHGLWVHRGIVIPCFDRGWSLRYIKVRRPVPPMPGPKYMQVKGGKAALFGLSRLTAQRVAVICEGELDAILLWALAGDLVDVVALGSKATKPAISDLAYLAGASRWLVALDQDADEAAEWWGAYSARVRRVRPLQGNDLTDFYKAGGDLRAWVTYHLEKLDPETVTGFDAGPKSVAFCSAGEERDPGTAEGKSVTLRNAGEKNRPTVEAQAGDLLARLGDDPQAARQYAELAEREGWPCAGGSWQEWADEVARGGVELS